MSADSLVPVDRGVFNSSPSPPGPGVVPTYPERCNTIDYHYDPIPALICAMFLVFGVVYTLFGKVILQLFESSQFIYKIHFKIWPNLLRYYHSALYNLTHITCLCIFISLTTMHVWNVFSTSTTTYKLMKWRLTICNVYYLIII